MSAMMLTRHLTRYLTKKPHYILNGKSFIIRSLSITAGGTDGTVFALSSAQGKAGVAVVRVSGSLSSHVIRKIGRFMKLPNPRKATLRKLTDPHSGIPIDNGLVLWFPGPKSFTGEDSAEFHVHGSTAVVLALLDSLSKLPGLKHAEPGDFTKRAFLNGKLDLTEVEGLADLIHAETESQRMQALRQMEGDLSRLYSKWSEQLLKCVAHIEAIIDFGEEDNIEDDVIPNVVGKVKLLIKELQDHLNDGRKGERLRAGINVAIIGAPNVGKSSLLNILCQRPAAIVSAYAGTTRDVLESSLDIFGYPIVLSDTAGLRKAINPIEEEGIRRAVQRGQQADLKIVMGSCLSLNSYIDQSEVSGESLTDFVKVALDNYTTPNNSSLTMSPQDTIIVMNKTDLHSPSRRFPLLQGAHVAWISCKTGDGIQSFLHILKKQLEHLGGNPMADSPRLTQTRHRHHLKQCMDSLEQFLNNVSSEADLVFAAEELREALHQLGRITGRVGIEDILDVVFSEFCIGK